MGVIKELSRLKKFCLFGGMIFLGGSIFYVFSDKALKQLTDHYRPEIEKELSAYLGHTLEIGAYKGLRPWGFALGSSTLLNGQKDRSTASVFGLNVQFAPIASLLSWRPVAVFTPIQTKINLVPNQNQSYWVLGESTITKTPNIDIRIRFDEPAKISIPSMGIKAKAKAKVTFNPLAKVVQGNVQIDFNDKGKLRLDGKSSLSKLNFKGRVSANKLEFATIQNLIPSKSGFVANGLLNGNIYVAISDKNLSCKGSLNLKDLKLKQDSQADAISSKNTKIKCNNKSITIPNSTWNYGPWLATIRGNLPTNSREQMKLALSTFVSLKDDKSSELVVDASIPILINKEGLDFGVLTSRLNLESFNLNSLKPFLGLPISGNVSLNGSINGPFSNLKSNISLGVDNPQLGSVRLREKWRGDFEGFLNGGAELQLSPVGAAVPGSLKASFSPSWNLNDLTLKRLGGEISLRQDQDIFVWEAQDFRLDRIEILTPLQNSFQRIFGKLIGKGSFKLNPLFVDGEMTYRFPRLIGLKLREAQLKGSFYDDNYSLTGEIFPPDSGQISITTEGRTDGRFSTKATAKNISPRWIAASALELSDLEVNQSVATGMAKDLKGLSVKSSPGALDGQLRNWVISVLSVEKTKRLKAKNKIINPDRILGQVNAVVDIEGPALSQLKVDISASGKIWLKGQNINPSEIRPFIANYSGRINQNLGEFSLLNIPFSILSLFIEAPSSLGGMFGITGRYRLKKGFPEITADLVLTDAQLAEQPFLLERGKIFLSESLLNLDISIRSKASSEPLTLIGQVPLAPGLPFDFRIESHGDGLVFLDGLTNRTVTWKDGRADLRLYIRGTYEDPSANGFLVFRDTSLLVLDKEVENFNSELFFDFNRLEVLSLEADVASNGKISSSGSIGLFSGIQIEQKPLSLKIRDFRLKKESSEFLLSSILEISGSLIKPVFSGSVNIQQGSISTKGTSDSSKTFALGSGNGTSQDRIFQQQLPEQKWDRKNPLQLFIQDKASPASKILRSGIPRGLAQISFDSLRLSLGPSLQFISPPIATFDAEGALTLNGPLSDELEVRGVVRLDNGRFNLFATSFDLDRKNPNVAIFAPSTGLIPYVDLKITTRVPDTIQTRGEATSSEDYVLNGRSIGGIGGSRFVKVEITAIGPADRLSENFQIRSSPPLPTSQLLDLIGGNSLTMLLGGGETELLANLFNRSFVSPVLGDITGNLSERLQLSVYPAYVRGPDASDDDDNDGRTSDEDEMSPQKAWVTEIGIDLSERINLSIQATPNREDVPPQGTIKYQLNPNLGILGSVDNNGKWQSEFQIYLRY